MVYIYVLECEQNKYYVGKTNNPTVRLEDHKNNNGAEWTKIYKPIKVVELIPNCDDFDEDKYFKRYAAKYGIDNVRGGSYSQIKLSNETLNFLQREISGATDVCFKCGKKGHFIQECKEKDSSMKNYKGKICYKCGRKGHFYTECYAKKHIDGRNIDDWNTCYKCGRQGHWLITCGEQTDIYGRPLESYCIIC